MSRPLPWVVRVNFKFENSMKGVLCSGNRAFPQIIWPGPVESAMIEDEEA